MRRDNAIDIARGVAILSMIAGHFAEGRSLAKPFHAVSYFDGASAFVLLSGLLLGIVHRRRIDSAQSLGPSQHQITRRVAVIYLCQLTISLLAIAITAAGRPDATHLNMPSSWWQVAILRYLPPGGDVLSLYFVLMVAAFGVLAALRAGRWRWIMASSFALYLAAIVAPYNLWNYWASWQILFVPAVVLGWYWADLDIGARLQRRIVPLVSFAAVLAVMSIGFTRLAGDIRVQEILVDKSAFGPGRVIVAWVFVPALYVLIRFALGRVPGWWFRPLRLAGSRSLDSYVIQACLVMMLPVAVAKPWGTIVGTALPLFVFALCWAWAETRQTLGIDKLHRAPISAAHKLALRS